MAQFTTPPRPVNGGTIQAADVDAIGQNTQFLKDVLGPSAAVPTELSPNVNFETDVSGWVAGAGGVLSRSTSQSLPGGTASLQLTAGSSSTFPTLSVVNKMPVTAGVSYQWSMSAKADATPRQVFAQFIFFDVNGAQVGSTLQPTTGNFFTDSTTAFVTGTITTGITAPTNAVSVLAQIIVNGAAAGEVHYFDGISFTALAVGTGLVTQGLLAAGLGGKADLDNGVLRASQVPAGIGGNAKDINTLQNVGIVSRGKTETNLIIGNSGSPIPGTQLGLVALWMNRSSWDDLNTANYLYASAGYQAARAADPTIAADIGIPLIPHGQDQTLWNGLLDLAASNGAVTLGNGTQTTTDAIYTSYGKYLSDQGPAAGTLYGRLWWEFNINPPANYIDRAKFIAAWNRAVPLMRAGFAAQAQAMNRPNQSLKIVWCPLSDGQDMTTFWPDSANVDVVAMDIYDCIYIGASTPLPTQAQLRTYIAGKLKLINDFAVLKGKPCAMGEWGLWNKGTAGTEGSKGGGDDPAFIDQVFDFAEANNWVYLSHYNISALGPDMYLYDASKLITQQTDAPLSLDRYIMRSAGRTFLVGLDPLTGLLPEAYTPARLAKASLDAAYAPITGTPVKYASIYNSYNTAGQPMVSYAGSGTAGGSLAFNTAGDNKDATFFKLTPGTLDTATAANNVAGSITPLKAGMHLVTIGVGIQTNAAGQKFSVSINYGGSGVVNDSLTSVAANSGDHKLITIQFYATAADVAAAKKLTVSIYTTAGFIATCNLASDTFMRVTYLGA